MIVYHTSPFYTILCPSLPYHTIPYYAILYHSLPYLTIPHHTIPYFTILYHTTPYLNMPKHNIAYHTLPYFNIPFSRTHTTYRVLKRKLADKRCTTRELQKELKRFPMQYRYSCSGIKYIIIQIKLRLPNQHNDGCYLFMLFLNAISLRYPYVWIHNWINWSLSYAWLARQNQSTFRVSHRKTNFLTINKRHAPRVRPSNNIFLCELID